MANATTGKITIILQEELRNSEKEYGELGVSDCNELCSSLKKAFKTSARKECNILIVAVLSDDVFVGAEVTYALCTIVVENAGIIKHSFGPTVLIETHEMKTLTLVLMGGANPIGSAVSFMNVKKLVELQKKKTPKKQAPVTKAAAKAAAKATTKATTKPATKAATKAATKTSAAARRSTRGKPTVIVLDSSSPATDTLQPLDRPRRGKSKPVVEVISSASDSDSVDSPPALVEREEIEISSDSDSDSEGSYNEFNDMGFTQEGALQKKETAATLAMKLIKEEQDEYFEEQEEMDNAMEEKWGEDWRGP